MPTYPTVVPMPDFLLARRDEIAALCREYGVARLEVFGSAMTEEFGHERSDVDLLVEYLPDRELGWWADEWYELVARLESLLGHDVDLVEPRALDDPFFRHFANRTREALYDGEHVVHIGAQPGPDRPPRPEGSGVLRGA